jgi:hypothetical protein
MRLSALSIKCEACNGRGSIDTTTDPDCDDAGAYKIDWPGMARDLATNLAATNRQIDRLITALIATAEALHRTHYAQLSAGAYDWHDCNDPFCAQTAALLASMVDSKNGKPNV